MGDARANLRQQISGLRKPFPEDPETLALAEAAVQRLDGRSGENVESWAETLAADLARRRD